MTDAIDNAVAHALTEIRASRISTAEDLARLFNITPYAGEGCRRIAEDKIAAETPVVRGEQKTGNYKHTTQYRAAMARERGDSEARRIRREARRT